MNIGSNTEWFQLLVGGWRLVRSNPRLFYRRIWFIARSPIRGFKDLARTRLEYQRVQEAYQVWRVCQETRGEPAEIVKSESPRLSVLMPVYNPEGVMLEAAIESVLHQTYEDWELCIADDASTAPSIRPILESYSARDSRIHIVWREEQGHISAASNTALAMAQGEFVLLLDHDDRLAPHALAEVARVIEHDQQVDFVYSDEDKIDFDGTLIEPFFKPAWSPTLLATCNYITHLAAIRRTLVLEVGGFRDETVGSQDHDLFLRVAERARAVAHIPDVLYSWRKSATSTAVGSSAKPYAITAARCTLQLTIDRRGLNAEVQPSPLNGIFYVRRRLQTLPTVSLVVVGKGTQWREVLRSRGIVLCDRTRLLDDHLTATTDWWRGSQDLPIVDGIDALSGEFLLWIDASSSPANRFSVRNLLETAQLEGIGLAGGATMHGRYRTLLQAGIVIGDAGQPVYAYAGLPLLPQRAFYLNLKDLHHEVSAVYVGCCAVRRASCEQLGGWNQVLPPALAACDLSLRALEAGYANIYTPLARFERRAPLEPLPSVSQYRWPWQSFVDPFWNPHLNPQNGDGLPFRCGETHFARIRAGAAVTKPHDP